MKIDPGNWQTLSKLLDEWLDQPASSRSNWLANLGPEYSDVLPSLHQLLASHAGDADDGFLRTLPKLGDSTLLLRPGERLGPYRILSPIGRGGMGVVYAADRDDGKFGRRVAIKLVSSGLNTPAFAARLQQECRLLARLEHPNIARLFDAGVTEENLPYFVMEYVEGRPIDRFCAERALTVRERLQLFLQVCDAVQLAHQNLIVHRDLKPDNILVTEQAIPKLLDFGIAKALDEPPAGNETTLMAMTPAYASPEQVRGEPVGTAADVYALGCVLYKLLTGVAPHRLQGMSPAESVRSVCEEEPARASLVNRELGVDEDNILRMAMRKEASLRYRSVEQFAADIGSFLNNRPVLARPAGAGYRFRKFVRRRRIAVSVAAGFALLLAGFAGLQSVQLRRTTRERDRADRVAQFMSGMFRVADPGEARGNTITAREILDNASRDIDAGLGKDPELQAQMMGLMGQVYGNLGLYPRAHALLARAVDLRRRQFGGSDPQTLSSVDTLILNLNRQGRYSDAEKLQRETLEVRRRALGRERPDTLRSMSSLANIFALQGRYTEAESLQRETLSVQRRILGPQHQETLRSLTNLANTLNREGQYPDAENLQRQALDGQRRLLGPEHPETLGSMGNLAATIGRQGRYAEAEKLLRETLELRRRILGPEHPDTLIAMTDLASILKRQRHYAEAQAFEQQALETQRRVLGPEHPSTLMSMNNLSVTLNFEGHYAEAEALLRDTLAVKRRVLGPEHPETLRSMVNLATSIERQGRFHEAEKLGREALETRRRVLGGVHPDVALSTYNLAIIAERQGKRSEALKLLRDAIDHGLSPANCLGIERDPDLQSLHADPRFVTLAAYAKDRAAAAQKAK
jgi:tetratricopeptide (TPR) repeat protein